MPSSSSAHPCDALTDWRVHLQDSDFNEDHLNEKLKAITEKCQAVLVHNSKLQDQVNRSKVALDASGKGGAQI